MAAFTNGNNEIKGICKILPMLEKVLIPTMPINWYTSNTDQ